jgi:NTE family protein
MADARLPVVAIACQGGGSHAAFGAGVLHRLMEDVGRRFELLALSGTSGGAVNAVLAWSGLVQGGEERGPAEARRRLQAMWRGLEARTPLDAARNLWGQFLLGLPFTWEVSPYERDLGAAEEMVALLREHARLEAMPTDPALLNRPHLLVGATDIVNGVPVAIRGDGEAVVPSRAKLKLGREPFGYADVLASVAIPPLFKDVDRRGTAFWDGLFSVNPPVRALAKLGPDELWVVQINPQRARPPRSMRDIADRRNELAGNISLGHELDMVEEINEMIDEGTYTGPKRRIAVRLVDLGEERGLPALGHASKFDRSPDLLRDLFERGRRRAPEFFDPERCARDEVTRRRMELQPAAR